MRLHYPAASIFLWLLLLWPLMLTSAFPHPHFPHRHRQAEGTANGRIKKIVLLVMENRSFDHMVGWMKRLNPEVDGLTGAESNPTSADDENSARIFVNDEAEYVDPDPGHSFQAIEEEVFGGRSEQHRNQEPAPMNGFVQNAEGMYPGFGKRVMGAFRPDVVPVMRDLVMNFAVFDKWFAAVPASTEPNRFYIHSATSHGATSNNRKDLIHGFPQKSIFDSIDEAGLKFGIYFQNVPTTLFLRNLRKPKFVDRFHPFELFKIHAKEGKLPHYTVIEPRYFDIPDMPANDDHPSHDVAEGQKFLKEVYETLRGSPTWNETLFLVTYDEHGGFFDHVPTPLRGVPNPDGLIGPEPFNFKFDRLGVRVATLAISPWVKKGLVIHEAKGPTPTSQYEHSSIPATVKKLFNLPADFLTARDAWAGTFEDIFEELDEPRTDCPETLAVPPQSLRHSPPTGNGGLSEWQEELVMLAAQLGEDSTYYEETPLMNVKEAHGYVQTQVDTFFRKKRAEANLLKAQAALDSTRKWGPTKRPHADSVAEM